MVFDGGKVIKKERGTVIKGIGGFYYVKAGNRIIETFGRGILKKDGSTIKIGDDVMVQSDGESSVITEIFNRKNEFIRPPVSNIDGMIIVISPKNPKPNFDTIDKLIVMAEKENIEIAIAINKCDISSENQKSIIGEIYGNVYPIYLISAEKNIGTNQIKDFLKGKKVALAGSSGVGKSTLINSLKEESLAETGQVSEKNSRGRHTTRHVEIFTLDNGGMVFDTPGFSSFDLFGIKSQDLIKYYRDLYPFADKCKFTNCSHIKGKECEVRNAVRTGKVSKNRYLSFKKNYLELNEKERY